MRAFFLLTRMRVLDVLRKRSSAAFFLAFPLILLVIVGFVFADGHPFERRVVLVVGNNEQLSAMAEVLRGQDELRVREAPSMDAALGRLRSRMATAVLTMSDDDVRLVVGPRDRIFGLGVAQVLERPVDLQVLSIPAAGYVHYLFPGLLTFSVLIAGLFGMGYPMVRYRQNLFLKKLATTPLSRSTFVAAQIAARTLLILVQMALLVVAAVLLFDLPVTLVGLAWVTLITVLGLITFMGAGFALACVIHTEDLMVDVISAINFPIILLSELFFPTDVLPSPLPAVADALPSTHMVRLTRAVLLYGTTDVASLLPGLLVMAGWAAATFAVSLWLFRWHR